MQTIKTREWYYTSKDEPRGYIEPHALTELWFHTGTACNLTCPFCLEGSRPGDDRLQPMKLTDVAPFINEALTLGVQRFAFTGGEPFVVREFHQILALASQHKPCLVLTNGTAPLHRRMHQLEPLAKGAQPIHFRVSIDYPDPEKHDAGRGQGSFEEALKGILLLQEAGFEVSVARQMPKDENREVVEARFREIFAARGIPSNTHLVPFPDFLPPHSEAAVPEITEGCMTRYQTEVSRRAFMCAYTKMLVKMDGRIRVYACTLVDDNPGYDLGDTLTQSLDQRIMLKHHRCYSCFAYGSSCSG